MGPLQLAIHMLQNCYAGEQKYHVNGLRQRASFEMLCNRRIINPTVAYREWHLMNYCLYWVLMLKDAACCLCHQDLKNYP